VNNRPLGGWDRIGFSATFRNSWKVDGLKPEVLPDPRIVFVSDECQRFFLLPNEGECIRGPPELIGIRLDNL